MKYGLGCKHEVLISSNTRKRLTVKHSIREVVQGFTVELHCESCAFKRICLMPITDLPSWMIVIYEEDQDDERL